MIEKEEIYDLNHVMKILNDLQDFIREYEEIYGEISEEKCENIQIQLAEIDGFIIGSQSYTGSNIAMADIRMMLYWDYINGKCDFLELIKGLKKYEGEV